MIATNYVLWAEQNVQVIMGELLDLIATRLDPTSREAPSLSGICMPGQRISVYIQVHVAGIRPLLHPNSRASKKLHYTVTVV